MALTGLRCGCVKCTECLGFVGINPECEQLIAPDDYLICTCPEHQHLVKLSNEEPDETQR